MQTFLPHPDFAESAKVLDYRRLGKQRVEVLQLLKAIRSGPIQVFDPILSNWFGQHGYGGPEGKVYTMSRATPWHNHPAAKMWRGYENALVSYGLDCCAEWIERGYKDTCMGKIESYWDGTANQDQPPWLGNPDFHAAHRSNLLRKDPIHYGQEGWTEPNDLPYIWPV
jgi:hypothetical protein